jgi:hypothetical protein
LSGRDTGPESGAPGEKFIVAHVVRPVAGKGQADNFVENIYGCCAQLNGRIDQAQRLHRINGVRHD